MAHRAPACRWLGKQSYVPLMERMQHHATAVRDARANEEIWFCHHPPVYTTGRRAIDNRTRPELPAPLVITDRGGETTFHGPGQLICYPIIHLRRRSIGARDFVHMLEESSIQLLAKLDIPSRRRCDAPGVWTDRGKIAAIGLRIGGGVSWHGVALNHSTAHHWFNAIRPCGLEAGIDRIADHREPPPIEQLARDWFVILEEMLPHPAAG